MVLNKKTDQKKKRIIEYLSSQVENEDTIPSILQICITTSCQLNCSYCKMGRISPHHEMNLSTLKKGIDLLLTSRSDVITFQIFGGEPLLRWDLVKKGVEYFKEKTWNIKKVSEVSLATNAVLLTEEKINFFKRTGVDFDVVFSFDGREKTQNFNRPPFKKELTGKYFDLILQNLKTLISAKIDFFVNMVVGPENLNELEENVNFLVRQGVKSIRLSYAMSVFWSQKAIKNFFLLVTKLYNKYKKDNLLIGIEHCLDEPIITSSALTLMPNKEIVVGTTYPLLEFFPNIKEVNSFGRLNDYQSLDQIKRNKREEIKKSLEILSRKDDKEFFLWANNVYMGILYEKLFEKLEKGSPSENDSMKNNHERQGTIYWAEDSFSFFKWGNKKMKNVFMLNYDLFDISSWLRIGGKERLYLRCGDIECCYMFPHPFNFFGLFSIFESYGRYLPYSNQILRNDTGQLDEKIRKGTLFKDLILNYGLIELKESDIIFGTGDMQIYKILNKVSQENNRQICFICSCINKVTGTNIPSLIEKINRKRKGLPIICDYNSQIPFIKELKKQTENIFKNLKKGKQKKTINLIGFEYDHSLGEILEILRSFFNIKLNITLFPELDLTNLNFFYEGKLQIINFTEFYQTLFDNFFGDMNLNSLILPPPYGIERTVDWFKAIGSFFSISIYKNKRWQNYYNKKISKWNELKKDASKFKIGIIASETDIWSLIDEKKYPFAIPLLKCLEEMGFRLDILITSPEDFDLQKQLIFNILKDKKKHRIELLNDEQDLEEWIHNSDCNCIYSDFRDDKRILLNGKIPFSLFLFEKGIDGAIRTLKKLLQFCKINFFNRYSKYNVIKHTQ